MNNFIIIDRTFAEVTPESAEDSDYSDHGFVERDKKVTFRELVRLMKEHPQCSDLCLIDKDTWFSTGFYTYDYRTATEREECIHFSLLNTPNAEKYWKLAHKIATRK